TLRSAIRFAALGTTSSDEPALRSIARRSGVPRPAIGPRSLQGVRLDNGRAAGLSQQILQLGEPRLGPFDRLRGRIGPTRAPVWTLPASNNASCCSMLACSCLHHAMKRSGAAMTLGSVMTRVDRSHSVGKPVTKDGLGEDPCARDLLVDAR